MHQIAAKIGQFQQELTSIASMVQQLASTIAADLPKVSEYSSGNAAIFILDISNFPGEKPF